MKCLGIGERITPDGTDLPPLSPLGPSLAQDEPVSAKCAVLLAVRRDPCRRRWKAGYLSNGVPLQHGASPPNLRLDGRAGRSQPCSTGSSCPIGCRTGHGRLAESGGLGGDASP